MILTKIKDKQEFLHILNFKRNEEHSTELLKFLQGYIFSHFDNQDINSILYISGYKTESYYNAKSGTYETFEQVMKNVYYNTHLNAKNAKNETYVERLLHLVNEMKNGINIFPIPTKMDSFIYDIITDKKLSIYKLPLTYKEKIDLL